MAYWSLHIKNRDGPQRAPPLLFLQLLQRFGERVVFKVILLLHIFIDVFFRDAPVLFLFSAFLERRKLLPMAAYARECLPFAFSVQFQALLAVRAASIRVFINIFLIIARTVFAAQHFAMAIFNFEHKTVSARAFRASEIIMLERRVRAFNLTDDFFRVRLDFRDELI